jgi:pimeloyl-ACP methyl ester carboxylesterase
MLREAGHEVYTPPLTGIGERSRLTDRAINLDTHMQDIVNVFMYEGITDAILCGHSYGGMVITGVANEIGERIRTLFYIDADAPADGQSLVDITGAETALAFLDHANGHGGMIPPIPPGSTRCQCRSRWRRSSKVFGQVWIRRPLPIAPTCSRPRTVRIGSSQLMPG